MARISSSKTGLAAALVAGGAWLFGCSASEAKHEPPPGAGGTATTLGGAAGASPSGGATAGGGGSGKGGSGGGATTGGFAGGGASGAGIGGFAGSGVSGASTGGFGAGGASGRAGAGSAGGGSGGASGATGGAAGGKAGAGGAAGSGEITLNPTPGNYRQTCDGSLGVVIDADHFLDGNDEDQGLRIYRRGADANPVATIDVSSALGLGTSDEADLEDAARIENRVYLVSSHGRDSDGNLERERYRFFAVDVSGTAPNVALTPAGSTTLLLDQMLSATNWTTPSTSVIAALTAASNLGESEDANLAPKANGTSIEALAWAPTAARPKQLLIGFRNPTSGSNAIVVSLLNADAVLAGATASFGEATLVNLGGLGLRAMTYSPLHGALLLVAGPKAGSGPYRLFRWSGPPSTTPTLVEDITSAPSDASPEAIVVYPNTRDIQLLFDQGDHLVGSTVCKDVTSSSRFFSDLIVRVP